ncbi:MAG: PAS domain S-box protein [Anaerolineae bacterium]
MKSSRLFSWFNRRSYSQKFIIIGLLFVVSLAGFYPMGHDQLERRENYGIKELEGTLYLRSLQTLLTDLNKHHVLALQTVNDPGLAEDLTAQQAIINNDMAELAQLDEKYGESLQLDIELETLQDSWRTVLQAAEKRYPFEINARHFQINKAVRRAITRIGNTSYLILDPDLDTYYMMDIVLLEMPEFQDLLNQITLIVSTADMQGDISEGDRLELITLSSQISSYLVQLRSSNQVSWNNDETGQMRQFTALPLNDLEVKLSAFINAITGIALVIGSLLMRAISRPLGELAVAAGRLGAGERDVHVPVSGEDEVGQVGFAFNTMVSELEAAQKKQEAQLSQLTQLTRALETSANISRRLSTILDPSQLMEAVVTEVQRAFNYYHAHIYLLDEAKENLVMAGGTGEAGKAMLASGHKLALGQGLVGRAAVTNMPVLVPDVSKEPGWLPNKLLPDTKAEAAIPITLGEQVLGVLDVQHNVIGGLDTESVAMLQSVANQVAIALENGNLFAERRRANEEMSRFKLALERSPNAVFMTDVDGTILYVNSGFEKVYGFSAEEAIGQTPRILKSGLISQEQYAHFWQTLLAKEPTTGEIVNKTKDGRFIPISASNNPIIDENGQLVGFLSLHVDMTERKEAETLLAKQTRA